MELTLGGRGPRMMLSGGRTTVARRSRAGRRGVLITVLAVAFTAAGAANASATFRIEQHTEPAGDTTAFHYVETDPRQSTPIEFDLRNGEHKDFGPFAGIGTAQVVLPAGWRVVDIQCVSAHPGAPATFTVDVPNGRVSANHAFVGEDSCAFTLSRIPATTQGGTTPGVAPTPPLNFPNAVVPRRPAVVGVRTGRNAVNASVRITRRSVIRAQLLRGSRVVGSARIVRNAGTYDVVVRLTRRARAQFRRQGLTRVTLTLRYVVVPRNGKTFVFRQRAVVRL